MINDVNCTKNQKTKVNLLPRTYWSFDSLDYTKYRKNIFVTFFGATQTIRKPAYPRYDFVRDVSLK